MILWTGYLACARCSASGVCLSIDPISLSSASDRPLQVPATQRCPNCSGAGKVKNSVESRSYLQMKYSVAFLILNTALVLEYSSDLVTVLLCYILHKIFSIHLVIMAWLIPSWSREEIVTMQILQIEFQFWAQLPFYLLPMLAAGTSATIICCSLLGVCTWAHNVTRLQVAVNFDLLWFYFFLAHRFSHQTKFIM